jgi:hypothetical protein
VKVVQDDITVLVDTTYAEISVLMAGTRYVLTPEECGRLASGLAGALQQISAPKAAAQGAPSAAPVQEPRSAAGGPKGIESAAATMVAFVEAELSRDRNDQTGFLRRVGEK